jgi:hypothetical protein
MDGSGLEARMQQLEQRVELCATPRDLAATVEAAREAARAACVEALPALCATFEREAAAVAASNPTVDSLAALIATGVSEAVGGMEARLSAEVGARLEADGEAAEREQLQDAQRALARAQAELRNRVAECKAAASSDVRALRRRTLPLASAASAAGGGGTFAAFAVDHDGSFGGGGDSSVDGTGADASAASGAGVLGSAPAPAQLLRLRQCNRSVAEHRARLLQLQKAAAQQERLRLQHDRDASMMTADAGVILERHFLDAYFEDSGNAAQLVADVDAMEERAAALEARLRGVSERLASAV